MVFRESVGIRQEVFEHTRGLLKALCQGKDELFCDAGILDYEFINTFFDMDYQRLVLGANVTYARLTKNVTHFTKNSAGDS